jgi:hypothetical protein
MEPLDSYYVRCWKRFCKDATPWARDNILWGIIVLVGPLVAAHLLHRHLLIDLELIYTTLWLYAAAAVIYVAVHICRIPKKLDDEREVRESALASAINERNQAIATLSAKPQRTRAEQHDYDKLKKVLETLKEPAITALRHIRSVGTMTFGGPYSPTLPSGLTLEKALWVYRHCATEGLLTYSSSLGMTQEVFSVLPKMDKIFDEVLFEEPGFGGFADIRRK